MHNQMLDLTVKTPVDPVNVYVHGRSALTLARKMKKQKKILWVLISSVLILGAGGCIYGYLMFSHTNDLGLSRFDLRMGDNPDIEILRSKTKSVADAYLARNKALLTETCGESYELAVNYPSSSHMKSLGFRSSFYYFCWDIYIPYLLKTKSGNSYTVVVQLSDRIAGNKHDTDKFHVLRSIVLDDKNQIVTRIENTANQGMDLTR